jgi:hypothetical protein
MRAFWDIEPCSLVEVNLRPNRLVDGGYKHLYNVDQLLRDHTDSYSPPWVPETSPNNFKSKEPFANIILERIFL